MHAHGRPLKRLRDKHCVRLEVALLTGQRYAVCHRPTLKSMAPSMLSALRVATISEHASPLAQQGSVESGEVGPINIGNPGEHTMLVLAETVLRPTGSHSRLVFRPLP